MHWLQLHWHPTLSTLRWVCTVDAKSVSHEPRVNHPKNFHFLHHYHLDRQQHYRLYPKIGSNQYLDRVIVTHSTFVRCPSLVVSIHVQLHSDKLHDMEPSVWIFKYFYSDYYSKMSINRGRNVLPYQSTQTYERMWSWTFETAIFENCLRNYFSRLDIQPCSLVLTWEYWWFSPL